MPLVDLVSTMYGWKKRDGIPDVVRTPQGKTPRQLDIEKRGR
jgi:hypothetical protein